LIFLPVYDRNANLLPSVYILNYDVTTSFYRIRYEETHDHEDWDFRVVHVHKFFYDEQSKKKGLTRRDWSKFGVVMKDNNACEEAKWDEHLSWEYQPEDPVWKIHVVETVRNDEDPERDTW